MGGKFVSINGVWHPAKEVANMVNTFGVVIESKFVTGKDGSHVVPPGEPFIYNGPNREAVKMLKEANVEFFGRDFRKDPEFLQAVRNMGFQGGVEEYLQHIGFNEEEHVKKQQDKLDKSMNKEVREEKEEVLQLAGGKDFTGNKENNYIGGFGPERLRSPEELTKSTTRRRGRPKKS